VKAFSDLVFRLDSTTKTNERVSALTEFLRHASSSDKLWCIALLTGKRPKRPVRVGMMREWASEMSGIPLWLLEESYYVVGDLAETLSLILPPPKNTSDLSLTQAMNLLQKWKEKDDEEIASEIKEQWNALNYQERFVFNKLITGGFRIGISQKLLVRSLSKLTEIDEPVLSHRLMGSWTPDNTTYEKLVLTEDKNDDLSRPYPFYLAYPLEEEPEELGKVNEWQIEYKWDGIRGQIIRRKGETFIWSRGEELVTDRFPELVKMAENLSDDCVLDGEILAFKNEMPLTFNHLQTRIGRKRITKKILEESPVIFMVYDVLEFEGEDIREQSMAERRKILENIHQKDGCHELRISDLVDAKSWNEATKKRENSRDILAEGFMLKRKASPYEVGRKRGNWWKWKVEPMHIDAVMIYAMRGHGRRANLYTDYTLAVWKGEELVPFAKAYSGLTDAEFREVDRFVKKNTIDRFGPVRSVKPELVFEIGFEGIAPSNRHKSGIALRFPRILRWRKDKPASEANTLEDLQGMLEFFQQA
jgi:DNA ligase-1